MPSNGNLSANPLSCGQVNWSVSPWPAGAVSGDWSASGGGATPSGGTLSNINNGGVVTGTPGVACTIIAHVRNGSGTLIESDAVTTSYGTSPASPPAAVSNLTAAIVTGTNNIQLNFTLVAGAGAYEVWRDGVFLATLANSGVTTYTDVGAVGATHVYTIHERNSNACGSSGDAISNSAVVFGRPDSVGILTG